MPVDYLGKRSFARTVSNNANGDATVKLIVNTINTYALSDFVKNAVKILKRNNPDKMEFLKRLFYVADRNVKYLADDPGHEVVYTPLLLMKMGQGDCKKFSVFISALLKNAGYEPILKVVKYGPGNDWEHIYVIVKDGDGYITLDPVNKHQFNKEVKYYEGRLNYLDGSQSAIMKGNKLSQMGNLGNDRNESTFMAGLHNATDNILGDMDGIGLFNNTNRRSQSRYDAQGLYGIAQDYMNGVNGENEISGDEADMISGDDMGKRAKAEAKHGKPKVAKAEKKAARQVKRKKVFHVLAKTNPAFIPIRASFLTLVKIGGALQKIKGLHINLAAKLAQMMSDPEKAKPVLDLWRKFGGEEKVLMKAIVQAGKSSLHGEDNFKSFISGVRGPELAIPAAITAASPLLIAVIKAMKSKGVVSDKETEGLENAVQTAEDIAVTTQDGKFTAESVQALTTSPLFNQSAKEDNGGHEPTVSEISQEAAKETPSFLKESDASSKSTSENEGRQASATNQYLPTVQDKDTTSPTGKNMFGSLMLPTVWCRIMLLIILMSGMLHPVLRATFSVIAFSGLILTSIYLFTNEKKYNEKR